MTVLDAHLHLWDLDRGDYPWLGAHLGALHRSFLPDEAASELATHHVDLAILVQAEDSVAETRRLLEIADAHTWVAGVVGWIELDDPLAAAAQLDQLDNPRLCGVRHLVHDDPRDDFFDLGTVRRSLAEVADRSLALDVPDAWPRHLDAVGRLAHDLPRLTVVVDHLGKPPRGGDAMHAWSDSVQDVARNPGVVAKLSGLHAPGQPFTVDALRPVFDVALEAFGTRRLMFGSDWPMTIDEGGYGSTFAVIRELVGTLSADEQADIWHRTAIRTYRRNSDA